MLKTLAIENYRSLMKIVVPLGQLNVITGANGSGKSNLYRALRLLAETAQGGVVNALAREGGLGSTFWAGPEEISRRMSKGEVPIQGVVRKEAARLRLGFAGKEFGYAISFGLPPPPPPPSAFTLDPEIKRECIWAGPVCRPASVLVDRNGQVVRARTGKSWNIVAEHINSFDSIFSELADPSATPEILHMRTSIRSWRFYDHFRTDHDAAARLPQLGTRTPVLHHDGRDLVAALQTIREIGDGKALDEVVEDAFPGAHLDVAWKAGGHFSLELHQRGLLRPLSAGELSDGTLRYLLLVAALLTPRPPSLMVLNEPETSLHPDVLPALARLIVRASERTQVWVVSHSEILTSALGAHPVCHSIRLEKQLGQTHIADQTVLTRPAWHWPD